MYKIGDLDYYHTLTEGKLAFLATVKSSDQLSVNEKEELVSLLQIHIEQHTPKSQFLEIIAQFPQFQIEAFSKVKSIMARSAEHLLSREDKNQDPTIGAVESFLPATLLTEPTPLMRESVKKISKNIVDTLNDYVAKDFEFDDSHNFLPIFKVFVKNFIHESDVNYPGRFSLDYINQHLPPNVEKIKSINDELSILQIKSIIENVVQALEDPEQDFYRTLIMQNMFSFMIKHIPIKSEPNSGCTPEIANLESKFSTLHHGQDFRKALQNPEAEHARTFISDELMYQNTFYTAEQNRGRGKPDEKIRTNKLGIMRNTEQSLRSGIPELPNEQKWVDWTQCPYKVNSNYVGLMLDNEVPFVSSFSGTISLMMNLMVSSNVLQSKEEQYAYISACYSFIVGLGYHSTHEVLAPVAHCLQLIDPEQYKVTTAQEFKSQKKPNHPPNYYAFFKTLLDQDKDFAAKRTQAWDKTIDWYNNYYLQYQPEAPNLLEMLGDLTEYGTTADIIYALRVCSQCGDGNLKAELKQLLKECCFENENMRDIISNLYDNPEIDKELLNSLNSVLENITVFEETMELDHCVKFDYTAEGLKFYRNMDDVLSTGNFELLDLEEEDLINQYSEAIQLYLDGLNIDSVRVEEIKQVIANSLKEKLSPDGGKLEIAVINDSELLQLICNKAQEKHNEQSNKGSEQLKSGETEDLELMPPPDNSTQKLDKIDVDKKHKQSSNEVDVHFTDNTTPLRQKNSSSDDQLKRAESPKPEQIEAPQQESPQQGSPPPKPSRRKKEVHKPTQQHDQTDTKQQEVVPPKPSRRKPKLNETVEKYPLAASTQQQPDLAKLMSQRRDIERQNRSQEQVQATLQDPAPAKPKRNRTHLKASKLDETGGNEQSATSKFDRKTLLSFDNASVSSAEKKALKLSGFEQTQENNASAKKKKP